MKNDTKLIKETIKKMPTNLAKLDNIEYGQDSTGLESVWISFLVQNKKNKKLINNINSFSDTLTDTLFRSGINSWPYVKFNLQK